MLRFAQHDTFRAKSVFGQEQKMIWQFQDAQNKFEVVVANALQHGPQIIVQDGREVAVVLPVSEYRRMVKPQPDLLESPLADSGLTIAPRD
jgi:prevent-host-death family protein